MLTLLSIYKVLIPILTRWRSGYLLSYALFSLFLFEQIRQETRSAISSDGSINLGRLMDGSPCLDSLWNEVLRLTNSSSAVRTVLEPTRIGNKVLKPGHKVMSPFRQLHFNEDIFGGNINTCDPSRFVNKSSLARDPSYRPFGGGSTYCPGRFIARQEVFVFVALFANRFDIELALNSGCDKDHQPPFPKLESKKQTTGIMSPQVGEDLLLRVKRAEGHKLS